MTKQYQLIATEPLTGFDQSVLHMLQDIAEMGDAPKAMVCVVLMKSGEAVTFCHNAELSDMLLAKGHLEMDIAHDNILANLSTYVRMAEKEGLIEFGESPEWDDEEET